MMKLKASLFAVFSISLVINAVAQDYRWQQRVEYKMDIQLDVKTHKVKGVQKLTYYNNSKDTLRKVYYHLFFNAFQPGSMMDVRSRNLVDPDGRVTDRISKLNDNEIGYQHIHSLKQDGKSTTYKVYGTILEVTLAKPILPNTKTVFDMEYESQVPVQIRRSGRDSKEGIAYSMTQWYPKMAAYDHEGWHPYQYVAREFHGVFGDFDVKITLDPTYIIGGTGVLQNADKIGYGYEKPGTVVKRPAGDLTWHFIAKNVIDFAWAADPDYTHTTVQVPDGPLLHFFYQKNDKTADNWAKLPDFAVKNFQFMNNRYGKYPYESYAIIQGGDGGMEYPMCTLIAGEKSLGSLVGTAAHEISHSWYQAVLASNEAIHGWLDEGFADFTSQEFMALSFTNETNPHARSYAAYIALLNGTLAEPGNQHSDHFNTNRAYSTQSYALGTVFLHQLKYIIGEENFYKGMLRYYNTWKFRHPEPNDFIRVMEKVSGMQLKWYLSYMINTTKKIDYGIKNAIPRDNKTLITLERIGDFPMPVDVVITYTNGSKELVYIPLNEMLGSKPVEGHLKRTELTAWPWVNPTYTFEVNAAFGSIASIEIDPTNRLADSNPKNNVLDLSSDVQPYVDPTK
jgi:hypothetical protein